MLTLLFTGLLVGLISSFFGIGGGTIMVSVFYFLYPDLPPQTVISTSLGVIFCNSTINTIHFWKLKKVLHKGVIIPLTLGMVGGGHMGGLWALELPTLVLKKIFSGTLMLIALRLYFYPANKETSSSLGKQYPITWQKTLGTFAVGVLGGLISGLTGVGGGIVIVPILLILYQWPFSWISPHGNFAMSFSSFSGLSALLSSQVPPDTLSLPQFLLPYQWGHLNIILVALLVLASWPTARIGAKFASKVNPEKAQKALALLLCLSSLRLFFS